MSKYKVKDDPDAVEPCPFDNTHMIRHSRMPYHIMSCIKNHRHLNYKQCLFNARHWVPGAEFSRHKATCPDRVAIERDTVSYQSEDSGTYYKGDCSNPEQFKNCHVVEPSGEDWDLECDDTKRAFKWGEEDARDYFSDPHNDPKPSRETQRELRRPYGTPRVLHGHGGSQGVAAVPQQDAQVISQRLPNSLPMTHQAAAKAKAPGFGRGRGYGTLQQVSPHVGGAAPVSRQAQQQSTDQNGWGEVQTVRPGPGRGRGRGYGSYAPQTNTNGVGSPRVQSDEDACSSSSSTGSRNSSSARSRKPRAVNVPPVGGNGPPNGLPNPPMPFMQQSGRNVSLQGVGRGVAKPRVNTQGSMGGNPAFIVPNVNRPTANNAENEAPSKQLHRKTKKKLREIESIEKKLASGIALIPEEETKLGKKDEILLLLKELQMEQD